MQHAQTLKDLFIAIVSLDILVMVFLVQVRLSTFNETFLIFAYILIDINECTESKHNCSSDATCTDTEGGFNCNCKTGYSGDGVNCTSMSHFFIICLFII